MRIKFQADADLNQDIVRGVLRREPGIDFRTAASAGLSNLSDVQVLALAAREGRILVSHDRKTLPHAFADLLRTASSSGVVIISQKVDVASAIEDLVLVWTASDAEEWTNRIGTLPL